MAYIYDVQSTACQIPKISSTFLIKCTFEEYTVCTISHLIGIHLYIYMTHIIWLI